MIRHKKTPGSCSRSLLCLSLLLSLAACTEDAARVNASASQVESTQPNPEALQRPFPSNRAILESWDNLGELGHRFKLSLAQLAQSPTQEHLTATRVLWNQTFQDYITLTALRELLIAHSPKPTDLLNPRINPWPIAPGYVDRLPEYPYSGVISDQTLPMTAESLIHQHQLFSLEDATFGFHALAAVLWAQDAKQSDISLKLLLSEEKPQILDENMQAIHQRRRQFLMLAGEQLNQDLQHQRKLVRSILRESPRLSFLGWQAAIQNTTQQLRAYLIALSGTDESLTYPPCGSAPCNEEILEWVLAGMNTLARLAHIKPAHWPALQKILRHVESKQQGASKQDWETVKQLLADLESKIPVPPKGIKSAPEMAQQ